MTEFVRLESRFQASNVPALLSPWISGRWLRNRRHVAVAIIDRRRPRRVDRRGRIDVISLAALLTRCIR